MEEGSKREGLQSLSLFNMPAEEVAHSLCELSRSVAAGSMIALELLLGMEKEGAVRRPPGMCALEKSRFVSACGFTGFDVVSLDVVSGGEPPRPENEENEGNGAAVTVATLRRTKKKSCHSTIVEGVLRSPEGRKDSRFDKAADRAVKSSDEGRAALGVPRPVPDGSAGFYMINFGVVRERFPYCAALLEACGETAAIEASRHSSGRIILSSAGIPLSHPEQPEQSARDWAESSLRSVKPDAPSIIVFGFGDGVHLEALRRIWRKPLFVLEPRPELLKAVISACDLSGLLASLEGLYLLNEECPVMLEERGRAGAALLVHPASAAISGDALEEVRRLFHSSRASAELRPGIAVVGPMYGGSLPIAECVSRAFSAKDLNTSYVDTSSFFSSFSTISASLKDRGRAGAVEDQFVEMLSQLVLGRIREQPVDIVICLAQAPVTGRVLDELRAEGIITVLWFVEDCRRFLSWQTLAPHYDYVFLLQKGELLKKVEEAGAGRAIYLPLGCDPAVHRPLELSAAEKRRFGSTLSFVGAGYHNRRNVFSRLAGEDLKLWGTEWPSAPPLERLVQEGGRRLSVEDYVKIFNTSTINLNLHSSSERDGIDPAGDYVNPRTFELAACGSFQLVDTRAYLPELFVPEKELATFSDERELAEKIRYYLAHPTERDAIAGAGRARALAEHTYMHRVTTMLSHILADRYEQLSDREARSPWKRTLAAARPFPELYHRLEQAYHRGAAPSLEEVAEDIRSASGPLSEAEQKILFLYHLKRQVDAGREKPKTG